MPFTLSLLLSGCGCSEDSKSCRNNRDCDNTAVCIKGECIPPSTDSTSDSQTSTWGSDSDTNGTDDSSSATDTNGTDSESDSLLCLNRVNLANGAACEDNCDCASLHCQNGFCCASGECCEDAADCQNDLCESPMCQDGSCVYTPAAYECGVEDGVGQVCADGNVCDGAGNCVALALPDCGNYALSFNIACASLDATYECFDSCTLANAATNCASGATCVNGSCVDLTAAPNGSVCSANSECISGHCGDGFCCAAGECCQTPSDCSDECKSDPQCGSNNQCFYSSVPCGAEDTDGTQTCDGATRCNGFGECIDVTTCVEQGLLFGAKGSVVCDAATVVEDCFASCTSNAQCSAGSECDAGSCKVSNGGACSDSVECASSHCSNGVCCTQGNCCTQNSQCDLPCQTNAVCNTSIFQCELSGSADACGTQEADCTGSNRCDGAGNCVAVTDYCSGTGADTYSCSANQVVRDCRCNTNTDCDLDDTFCNGTYLCGADHTCKYDVAVVACPEESPCYANAACDEGSKTCSGDNPCDPLATECDLKQCLDNGSGGYSCEVRKVPDTTPCNDGSSCNGAADACFDGVCQPGPPGVAYCFDSDPCTVDDCTENDTDAPTCTNSAIAIGDACSIEYNCFGDNGTCLLNPSGNVECVPVEVPCTANGICSLQTCTEDFANDSVGCATSPNIAYQQIECGTQITLTAADFATRTYSDYSGPNDYDTDTDADCQAPVDQPFIGKEAVVYIQPDTDTDYTADLQIVSVDPAGYSSLDFVLFQEANICDWSTCTARQTDEFLGISLQKDALSPEIIIDSRTEYFPPTSIVLSLTCY